MNASLSDSIYNHILPEDFPISKDNLQKYIEEHQKETLFIIDGFDEINEEGTTVVQKLVQRRILPHSTVLLTSRPQYALHLLKYFDSLFVLNGYCQNQMDEFVEKFSLDMDVPIETFQSLLERIKSNSSMKDIYRNPLNLCFLCILCEERGGNLPNTRTEIYDEIVNMLLKKASKRLELSTEELESHLQQLCEIAFDGLQKNVFSFPAEQFPCEKVLVSMGFLNKEPPKSRLKNPVYYVFTHTSFQEYLAARHVSSLSKDERNAFLFRHLRGRHMSGMWGFFCGINRNNESILLDYFTAFEEQFCPMILNCPSPMESKHLLHMPTNIPFHRLSVQDITAGLHIQLFKCLKEINIQGLSPELIEVVTKSIPHHISFSHIFTSKTALAGLLSFLKPAEAIGKYQLIVSGQVFYDCEQNRSILALFKEIGKTGQVDSVGFHMITSSSQLKVALETFDLDAAYSPVRTLQLKFMSFVDISQEEIEELKLGHGLESLEIYDCSNYKLLARMLEQVAFDSTPLVKLVIQHCTLDEDALAKLKSTIKSAVKLTDINFTENHIQSDSELTTLPFLASLEAREPGLKSLAFSGLLSTQSWQADSTYCSSATNYLKNILLKNKLEHFTISKTVLHRSMIEVLVVLIQQGILKSVEIEYCSIICVNTFNIFLKVLCGLPELCHLSVKGNTVRSIQENQADIDSLTSGIEQVSTGTKLEDPPSTCTRFRRLLTASGGYSPRFRFVPRSLTRAISFPEGMHHAHTDERTASIHIIHDLLEKTESLHSLVLSDLHTDQLICLCKGLGNNTTLLSLVLLQSNVREACTPALCRFLEKHPCIREFSLSKSNMNSIAAESFFESVAKCKSLQTLCLNHCQLHDKHMPMLTRAMNDNLSICNVLLRKNSWITSDGVQVLYNGLKSRTKQIRIIDLSDCKITRDDEIVEQLKEVALVVKVNWF